MAFLRERRRKSIKTKVERLLEAWDVQGAIQMLRDHVADDQDDTGAVAALADLLRGRDPEAALALMQDLADRFPADWAVWAQFGQLACKLERWQLADETYQHALSLNPPESESRYTLHFQRGLVADEMAKPEAALLHYRHAQAERADDPDLWFNRGNSLLQARRFEEALTNYDTALRLSPEDHRIARQRAMALVCLGRLDDANALMPYEVWCEKSIGSASRSLTLRFGCDKTLLEPVAKAADLILQRAATVEWRNGAHVHVGWCPFTVVGNEPAFHLAEPDWARQQPWLAVREYVTLGPLALMKAQEIASRLGVDLVDSFPDDLVDVAPDWAFAGEWCLERRWKGWRVYPVASADKAATRTLHLGVLVKSLSWIANFAMLPPGYRALFEHSQPRAIVDATGKKVLQL